MFVKIIIMELKFTTDLGHWVVVSVDEEKVLEKLHNEGHILIGKLCDLTEEDYKTIVPKYGPFGEFKGSKHPTNTDMRYNAYQQPGRAFKCLLMSASGGDLPDEDSLLYKMNVL